MVNDLRDLLHDEAASGPADHGDLTAVLSGGRRRVRRRRVAVTATALMTAAVVVLVPVVRPGSPDLPEAGVPRPEAPTLRLTDADTAVEGEHYRVLETHTNEDLEGGNGQYFDGVTDDGLILFRDGPRVGQWKPRYGLLDPATGETDWLPDPSVTRQAQLQPIDLGERRLVLLGVDYSALAGRQPRDQGRLYAMVYDREDGAWDRLVWPALPPSDDLWGAVVGPDERLYLRVPATAGRPPAGGWPTGPDGEADDADAEGDTYDLWSASLEDGADLRDERLTVGEVAFADNSMVWTDATNGDSGLMHVRDLGTGQEHSFDPRAGSTCNLLSFGATGERIVMGQYCGTHEGGVRDDRVQVVSTDGEQVVTVQDDAIDGGLVGDGSVVTISSYQRGQGGTYVYDLATDRFLRVSEHRSAYAAGGPTPGDLFLWSTPTNGRKGATQWLGELVD